MAIEQNLLHKTIEFKPTNLDKAIAQSPSLEELGRSIFTPQERKDNGAIEYTTVAETIRHWAQDPLGERKFEAISALYGIPREKLMEILSEDPGMEEYLRCKAEGRFVGMVSTQINKPSLYFMTNALMLAQLHKRGVPVALMMLEYPNDTFFALNSDKGGAFGKVEFPIGKNADGTLKTLHFSLKPAGYIAEDGEVIHVPNMKIENANGMRCDKVLVKIDSATDPHTKRYPNREGLESEKRADGSIVDYDETKAFLKASLGIEFDGEDITLTDFYRLLWNKAIDRLREISELPSKGEMPVFFVDMSRVYTDMAKAANPPTETIEALKFDTYEKILGEVLHLDETTVYDLLESGEEEVIRFLTLHNFRIENGLLVHKNGMMDAATYYVAQIIWPDLYIECSSCGGEKFVQKLARALLLRHMLGIPDIEVRLPDVEIPELEAFLIHPGRHVDRLAALAEVDKQLAEMGREIAAIAVAVKAGEMKNDVGRRNAAIINDDIKRIREAARRVLYEKIMANDPTVFTESEFILPDVAVALLKKYLEGVDEAIAMIQ